MLLLVSDKATGAMQQLDSPAAPGPEGSRAGFVLLYAEAYETLPAAWPFYDKKLVVGREPPAKLILPVHAVSRTHAEISWEKGGWTLRDLGSTNGTIVDGHRVGEARLEHGQEVRFGDAVAKFVARDADLYGRYRVDGQMMPDAARLAEDRGPLVGGYQIDRIAAEVERIAQSPLSVMLLGESGTGKEVVARELHRKSGRRGEFRAINCAAIPQNLLESELFGYKRGAFSGAERDKMGLIRAAHQGTLLLDEIGDMPTEAQAKLLRVLQSKEVYPIGATDPDVVDVRVVCATHRDLKKLQTEGRFRPDLFARINEYQLRLPPLRERKEDLFMLVRAFLERHGGPELTVSFRFMTGLLHYDWPYNVRELEACVKRTIALAESDVADFELLPEAIREETTDYGRPLVRGADGEEAEGGARNVAPSEEELRALLAANEGNIAAVGRALGKARMQIHRWINRYAIDLSDYRS